jgi:hypothetical protein
MPTSVLLIATERLKALAFFPCTNIRKGALSFITSTFKLIVTEAAFSCSSMSCFGLASHPNMVGLRLALRTEVTLAGLTPNPILTHMVGSFWI